MNSESVKELLKLRNSALVCRHGKRKGISTTMGLKYPLKKFDSQWPFPMGIWNDVITIFGKDCHIWNNAPRSLLSNVT